MDYLISYIDHRRDPQQMRCTAFEDAERVCQFLANLHNTRVSLEDEQFRRVFEPKIG